MNLTRHQLVMISICLRQEITRVLNHDKGGINTAKLYEKDLRDLHEYIVKELNKDVV